MIRINLLNERKTKREEQNQQFLVLAIVVLIGTAMLIYALVHMPLTSKLEQVETANRQLARKNAELQQDTKDFDAIKQQAEAVKAQAESILRLNNARAVPAWMLAELSRILTKDSKPTMTPQMAERVQNDPNRRFSRTWDPKRVWIKEFSEQAGEFKLVGGAQSDGDVTQLALRMMASVFFDNVTPVGVKFAPATDSGTSYYNFSVTGRVNY